MEAPEITEPTTSSIRLQARIAGVLYLFLIAGGIFAEPFVRRRLVVHGRRRGHGAQHRGPPTALSPGLRGRDPPITVVFTTCSKW
jgi:hypothetical protein